MLSVQDGGGASHLTWLPLVLPVTCKLVVSVSTGSDGVLESLETAVDRNVIHVNQLGLELAVQILSGWLTLERRTISHDQWNIVLSALDKYVRSDDTKYLRWICQKVTRGSSRVSFLFPIPSLSLPSLPPFPLSLAAKWPTLKTQLGGLGERCKLPAVGPGEARKLDGFCALLQYKTGFPDIAEQCYKNFFRPNVSSR